MVVEFTDGLLPTADRDLVKPLEDRLRKKFEAIYLNTKVASLQATDKGIIATLEGKDVPAQETFDRVLVSVGRRPNSANLGLDKAGVNVTDRGYIPVDKQRRTSVPHIFALGDVAEEPGLAHKATAEAKVAVETILGEPSAFEPRAIPAVVFTDPELAWAGLTERDAKEQNVRYEKLTFPWAASGRATTLARNDGLTKLLVDPATRARPRHRNRRRRSRGNDRGGGARSRNGRRGPRRRRQHSRTPDSIRNDHGERRTGARRGDAPGEAEEGEPLTHSFASE